MWINYVILSLLLPKWWILTHSFRSCTRNCTRKMTRTAELYNRPLLRIHARGYNIFLSSYLNVRRFSESFWYQNDGYWPTPSEVMSEIVPGKRLGPQATKVHAMGYKIFLSDYVNNRRYSESFDTKLMDIVSRHQNLCQKLYPGNDSDNRMVQQVTTCW
jgi:hypothetical protein